MDGMPFKLLAGSDFLTCEAFCVSSHCWWKLSAYNTSSCLTKEMFDIQLFFLLTLQLRTVVQILQLWVPSCMQRRSVKNHSVMRTAIGA